MKKLLCLTLTSLLFLFSVGAIAQKKPVKKSTPPKKTQAKKPVETKQTPRVVDPVADEKKVRDIISFLEYMLNTMGSSKTSSRDKEVLVTQSYSKIFRDGKVQVEDDLDEARKVITNKNVVAYLKDVDFFFKDVKFELPIEEIKANTLASGEIFYKVSVRRTISGTNTDGKPVNNSQPRYIEVNYDPSDQDLRIVSMYTNQINEKDALTRWWSELSYEWQAIFSKKLNLTDSADYDDIKRVITIQDLNLTNNRYIRDLEPLTYFTGLQRLDLSGSSIQDISPIRNCTELVELNLSGTQVVDLTPLRYAIKLEKLNITNTRVSDIGVVVRMAALKHLEMQNVDATDFTAIGSLASLQYVDVGATKIASLSPFESLTQLSELHVAGTAVQDLSPLKNLRSMTMLDLDSTRVTGIQHLSGMENLKELHINHTQVADLTPLKGLTQLQKIYCDQTRVSAALANDFMAANTKVLVIYDSKDMKVWWDRLSPSWQAIFSKASAIGIEPTKEELAKIPLLDSINLSGNASIISLEPLERLPKLRSVNASRTGIADLSPLRDQKDLVVLHIAETEVRDLTPIRNLTKLKVLHADKSKIENIELLEMKGLEKFYADQTAVQDIAAREFLVKNPTCLLIYKTVHLNRWWDSLTESWKDALKTQAGASPASRESLHKLVEQESLRIKDAPVSNLKALREFVRLNELHFSGTNITSISTLENLKSLKSLHATHSPIQKIDSIFFFSMLEDLDISNTPIEDIYPTWKLKNLKSLNCSGTQIKRLDALEKMTSLEFLDCSNTKVNRLNALDYLPLKTLKCYNTAISNRAIENFKASHPDCNVIYYR